MEGRHEDARREVEELKRELEGVKREKVGLEREVQGARERDQRGADEWKERYERVREDLRNVKGEFLGAVKI